MLVYEVMEQTTNSQRKDRWNADFDSNGDIHRVRENLGPAAKEWRNDVGDVTGWYDIAYRGCYVLKGEAGFANDKIRPWVGGTGYKALPKDPVKRAESI